MANKKTDLFRWGEMSAAVPPIFLLNLNNDLHNRISLLKFQPTASR